MLMTQMTSHQATLCSDCINIVRIQVRPHHPNASVNNTSDSPLALCDVIAQHATTTTCAQDVLHRSDALRPSIS